MNEWVAPAIVVAVVCTIMGCILTYLFTNRGNDNRDFNQLADPIRHRFEKQAAHPRIYNKTLADDIARLRHHLNRRQQSKYDEAIENYKTAISEFNQSFNEAHEVFYTDKALVTHAAQAIVKLLPRR